MDPDDLLLTVREAAALCRLAEQTLNRLRMHKGAGPPFIKIRSRVFYPRSLLLKWIRENLRHSTSELVPPDDPEDPPTR